MTTEWIALFWYVYRRPCQLWPDLQLIDGHFLHSPPLYYYYDYNHIQRSRRIDADEIRPNRGPGSPFSRRNPFIWIGNNLSLVMFLTLSVSRLPLRSRLWVPDGTRQLESRHVVTSYSFTANCLVHQLIIFRDLFNWSLNRSRAVNSNGQRPPMNPSSSIGDRVVIALTEKENVAGKCWFE